MRKPAWYHRIAIVTVIGLIGCATVIYPPPSLQKNKYTNFEYQYTVDIPEGWKAQEKVPKDLANLMGGEGSEESKAFKLVLVNKFAGGMIAAINMRHNNSFKNYLKAPPEFFKKQVLNMKANMERTSKVIRFDYSIHQESIAGMLSSIEAGHGSYKPKELLNIEVDEEYLLADQRSGVKFFMYPCQENKTCITALFLSSELDKYEGNLPAYDEIISSLTVNIPKAQP